MKDEREEGGGGERREEGERVGGERERGSSLFVCAMYS